MLFGVFVGSRVQVFRGCSDIAVFGGLGRLSFGSWGSDIPYEGLAKPDKR